MPNHKIERPKLFVSHASSDGEFANAVVQEIQKVFANGIDVFCTSSPNAIGVGADWLQAIEQKLGVAQAVIVIVTPVSIERPWIWFEIGASWSKGKSGDCNIYPLCAPEIQLSDLPAPLNRLQALSMGKAGDLKILFKALSKQFGFGNMSAFRATNITKRIPKYKDVKIKEVDLNDNTLYSGPYIGYSDEELMEVIDTMLFEPDAGSWFNRSLEYIDRFDSRETWIKNGKLLHFRQIDRELNLPKGTAKRLLVPVAKRHQLIPQQRTDNIIRFESEDEI